MADDEVTPERAKGAPWRRAFAVVLAVAGVTWLVAGAGMTFFSDEWAFIESRSLGDPIDWLRPHNEHWSTLPIILYRLMVETIGIGSYMPYLAVVVGLHLSVAAMVFRLVERRSGGMWALFAGSVVAFLGAGFENVFWGFQTGFVGSTLLGLVALEVTDGAATLRRAAGVAVLLLASLMSSGTGLVMCVVVGVVWLIDARWRRFVPVLALPAATYAVWLMAIGRTGVATVRNPFTSEALADVPGFVVQGFGDAAAAVTGLGGMLGILAALTILGWATVRALRRTLPPLAGGALVAIAVQLSLTALVRGSLFDGQVHYSRYGYVSGILLILVVSSLAGRWSRPERPAPRVAATVAAVSIVGLAFAYNGTLMVRGRELFLDRADLTRAMLVAGLERPLPPQTDPTRTLVTVPSPRELERIMRAYGDARDDVLVGALVRDIPAAVQAEADRRVREGTEAPLPER